MTPVPQAELRALVSEAVREAVAQLRSSGGDTPAPLGRLELSGDGPRRRTHAVRLTTDEDLNAFARQLLALFENPKSRQDVRNGWLRFRLDGATAPARHSKPASVRIDKGAVTERRIVQAAQAGESLLIARGAVLTPLARDKARALGVHIEKEH